MKTSIWVEPIKKSGFLPLKHSVNSLHSNQGFSLCQTRIMIKNQAI